MEVSPEIQARLDQIAKLPSAARGAIAAVILLLLGSGYYSLMYKAQAQQLEGLRAQEMELQRKLSEVRSITANIEEFQEEIANLELKLQRVLRQLPNEREIEVLLTDISNLGKTAGIEIKSFRRKQEVVHDFYAEVPIDIEIEGQFHDVARFFDLLAGLPRIVNMGAIDVKIATDTLEKTVLKVSGTATTFRFVGQAANPA
jgi:type IV pilus assembly protein PilO